MNDINYIYGSDGTGEPPRMIITGTRIAGATSLYVDSLTNVQDKFIATTGTVDLVTGLVDPATVTIFKCQIDAGHLEILEFAPGYTDLGNTAGQVIVIKPNTEWANNLADTLKVSLNDDGTLKTSAVQTALSLGTGALNGWNPLAYTTSSVTYLGNRSYSCVVTGQDVTGVLSPGMRIRTARTVLAPTQCTSLNGSTQYYSKATPAGMTFTNNFVVSAWVKLTSYAQAGVVSRWNGTSGWNAVLLSTGQIRLEGTNAAAGNFSNITSYQSLPLNKWVHIAAQLDMSAFTATTTTSYVMIDGVDVPASVNRAGTNPTALIQAGNLEIGSYNGGLLPFPGKIAQAFVSSAKIVQANVQTLYSQGLTSALITANNIISAYSFNGVITDLNTTNANNLTANGSAVATNADSPFGKQASGLISSTLDYAIITKAVFSTNTTLTVQVPEGCTIPTTGGVSAVSYSSVKAPYGMPIGRNKWSILTLLKTSMPTASNANFGAFQSGGVKITVPIGSWVVGYGLQAYSAITTGVYFNLSQNDPTGLAAPVNADWSYGSRVQASSGATALTKISVSNGEEFSVATTFIMYTLGASTLAGLASDGGASVIFADCAYL